VLGLIAQATSDSGPAKCSQRRPPQPALRATLSPKGERAGNSRFFPSPPWGRGWRAAPGEGVAAGAIFRVALFALLLLHPALRGLAWGPEGHHVTVRLAESYLTARSAEEIRELLGSENLREASVWADDHRHDAPETAAWHYIDIPLRATTINLERDCRHGDCVLVKINFFLVVLRNTHADRSVRAQALKFVIHFVADLHQPLHDEDNNDKGGNLRLVQLGLSPLPPGVTENLHWLWDTGLVERLNPREEVLAETIGHQITDADRAAWTKGKIEDWILEAHRLARTVAYEGLGTSAPAVITAEYEHRADPVIETQLAKAAVRMAFLLNQALP